MTTETLPLEALSPRELLLERAGSILAARRIRQRR